MLTEENIGVGLYELEFKTGEIKNCKVIMLEHAGMKALQVQVFPNAMLSIGNLLSQGIKFLRKIEEK